jgi:hypothetical protein
MAIELKSHDHETGVQFVIKSLTSVQKMHDANFNIKFVIFILKSRFYKP